MGGCESPDMLPPPTLSFTIPSIHDDNVLQCRIYHPACLVPNTVAGIVGWRKRGAIVAHPYAPLGGCYDDPVVDLVAATILEHGFVVGTFNFRYRSLWQFWNVKLILMLVEQALLRKVGHHGSQSRNKMIIYPSLVL